MQAMCGVETRGRKRRRIEEEAKALAVGSADNGRKPKSREGKDAVPQGASTSGTSTRSNSALCSPSTCADHRKTECCLGSPTAGSVVAVSCSSTFRSGASTSMASECSKTSGQTAGSCYSKPSPPDQAQGAKTEEKSGSSKSSAPSQPGNKSSGPSRNTLRGLIGIPGIDEACCQECCSPIVGKRTMQVDPFPPSHRAVPPSTLSSVSNPPPSTWSSSSNTVESVARNSSASVSSAVDERSIDTCTIGSNHSDNRSSESSDSSCSSPELLFHTSPIGEECYGFRSRKTSYFLRDVSHMPVYNGEYRPLRDTIEMSLHADQEEDLSPVNQLPTEVLSMIFSYLGVSDLLQVCSLVCRRWYVVVTNPVLWRKLKFCGQDVPIDVIIRLLWQSPLLKSFTIKDRTDIDLIMPVLHQHCHRLEHIKVVRCSTSYPSLQVPVKYLLPLVRNGKNLRTLSIKGTPIRSQKFFDDLAKLPKLESVSVGCVRGLTPQNVQAIASYPHLHTFRHKWHKREVYAGPEPFCGFWPLKAYGNWISAQCLLLQRAGPNLTTLSLDVGILQDQNLADLRQCTNLKALYLYNARRLAAEGMAAIGTMTKLTALQIYLARNLTAAHVASAFALGNLSSLKILLFVSCGLLSSTAVSTDGCMKTVAKNCRHLHHISLANCRFVTDCGVKYVLKYCSGLQTLDLYGTVSVLGHSFLDIPLRTPHLRELIIEEQCSSIKCRFMQELIDMFPTVQVSSAISWNWRTSYSHQE